MIIVARSLALSPVALRSARRPVLCWDSVVTISNTEADHELSGFPVTNLANPDTDLLWKSGSTADQYLTVSGAFEDIEALAVVRHNFGSGQIVCSVETLGPEPGDVWEEAVEESTPGNDDVLLFRFPVGNYIGVRLKLQPDAVAPQAALLLVAPLTILPGLPPGYAPINSAEATEVVTNRNQRGDFLGRIILATSRSSSIVLQNLDPTWYHDELEPFRQHVKQGTFVFASSPQLRPYEIAYCWVTNNPRPVISHSVGLIDVTFEIEGVSA